MADVRYPNDLPDGESWCTIAAPETLYASLDSLLNSAAKKGILSERPTSEEESRTSNYEVLASAIGERLALLGYTREEAHAARDLYVRDKEAFFQAVEAFQADARLKVDRWAGKKTWTALGYLVNFGSDDDDSADILPKQLLNCDPKLGAVRRAAKLRLRTLGLSSGRPSNRAPQASTAAIRKFHAIAKTFGMLGRQHRTDRLTRTSAKLLLDHDGMVTCLSQVQDPIRRVPPHTTFKDFRRFIVKVVRIELWLLGLDVDITSNALYPVAQVRGQKRKRHPEKTETGRHLSEFYRVFADTKDADRVRRKAGMIDQTLFEAFANIDAKGETVDDEKAARELREEVDERLADNRTVLEALKEGRSLGLQIWDGIKRAWRWIKRKIKRLIDIGKNLVRAFFRYACKGFQIARTAMRALTQSLGAYLSGRLQFPSEKEAVPAVCIRLYKDFDMRIGINTGMERAVLDESSDRMLLFSQRFLLSCRILSLVIAAVRDVALSFVGWALLAKAMVRHLREIIPLYHSIATIEEQLAA